MKGKIVFAAMLSLALVLGMAACDNGVAPDIGAKEADGQVITNIETNNGFTLVGGVHAESVGGGGLDLDKIFEGIGQRP